MTRKLFEEKKLPIICTPITGKTETDIMEQLQENIAHQPDLIEWRADFFNNLAHVETVLHIVKEIKATTAIPLLFTIRAAHEGGEEIALTEEEKVHILSEICRKTTVDIVDYETSNDEKYVQMLATVAKENNKQFILSYHDFTNTPANDELLKRAQRAASFGADIVKIAVMPESKEDVLRLLHLTNELDDLLDVSVVTMSMGDIGALSRTIGWAYGSIITFAVGAELSAPGQIPIKKLRETIRLTQELVPNWVVS